MNEHEREGMSRIGSCVELTLKAGRVGEGASEEETHEVNKQVLR